MNLRIVKNKKGDMPWWLTRLLLALAILVFILVVVYATRKWIVPNIKDIFSRW